MVEEVNSMGALASHIAVELEIYNKQFMKIKKMLFPFYKPDQHNFLKEKSWCRLLIVLFVIFVIATPLVVFFVNHSASSDWCRQNVQEKIREGEYSSDSAFREH